ncbi:MAG TPA: AAA family ATPase [Solirubrobacter sp.]|nr:AAA family ATPase [Solirubrobacter sp.]
MPSVEELRLTRFKSFRGAVLPLRDLTLLIGRNGSGKSNAIDALHVLELLAAGAAVEDEVRGGLAGCAPYGEASFALGCTVADGDARVRCDVEVSVADGTVTGDGLDDPAVAAALRQVFILDPVPALMRGFVDAGDVELRRHGENISAVVGALSGAPWERLAALVRALPEQQVEGIELETAPDGTVMLALRERIGDRSVRFGARVMSDGMLRFLAFAAALGTARPGTQLVIEEVENGLHPSQAKEIVRMIKAESAERGIRTFATTHSPAILTALDAADHDGVVVCRRDPATGVSRLARLVDLPAYPEALAAGTLGDAIVTRRLEAQVDPNARLAALDDLLADL